MKIEIEVKMESPVVWECALCKWMPPCYVILNQDDGIPDICVSCLDAPNIKCDWKKL